MDSYVRFPGERSLSAPYLLAADNQHEDDDDETPSTMRYSSIRSLFQKIAFGRAASAPESNYLTLIPLSDSRLKPRRTKLLVSILLLFTLAATCGVYFLVPRGISLGTVAISSQQMSWNSTTGTYQLVLQAEVPIFNPNYMQATVEGSLQVLFYDQEAGNLQILPFVVKRNSSPQTLQFQVDASNVPGKYHSVLVDQCRAFPRRLIFFLNGDLQVKYLGKHYSLPRLDTYFMINCINGKGAHTQPAPDSGL